MLGQYLKRTDPSFSPQTYGHLGLLNVVKTHDLLVPYQENGGRRLVCLAPKPDVPPEYGAVAGLKADVRRIEPSPSFRTQFGCPTDAVIDTHHALGSLLPIGRKRTRPTPLVFRDKNGVDHECLGEAFDTKHNIIIHMYPTKALTSTSVWLPKPPNIAASRT